MSALPCSYRRSHALGASTLVLWAAWALSAAAFAQPASQQPDATRSLPPESTAVRPDQRQESDIERWTRVLASPEAQSDSSPRFSLLIKRGEALRARGSVADAVKDLTEALAIAKRGNEPVRVALASGALGSAMLRAGVASAARLQLESSIAASRAAGRRDIEAVSRNELGNVLAAEGRHAAAGEAYRQSASLAAEARQPALATKARANAARSAVAAGDLASARELLVRAAQEADGVPSRERPGVLLSLGRIAQRLGTTPVGGAGDALPPPRRFFEQARDAAEALGDPRSLSFALGFLGELDHAARRSAEARQALQRAIFAAQEAHAPEIEYLWHWRIGRMLREAGDPEGAIQSLRLAVNALHSVRTDLVTASADDAGGFRTLVKPVFDDLVAELLDRSRTPGARDQAERLLVEARDTVEKLKTAELQDYFRNECVPPTYTRSEPLEKLAPRTAVVYPIFFADRVELLVSSSDRIRNVTSRVGLDVLTQEVDRFRDALLDLAGPAYLPHAKRLYDWLVRPIEEELGSAPIDTLVFVPDGPLRTVPLSALHDGRDFLIGKYAFVTSPGLTLTDVRPLRDARPRALVGGLSESVQGYPALPNVPQELDAVQGVYGGTRLLDVEFVLANLKREVADRPAGIVHIASHARFESDVNKSYILTYDGQLGLGQLEDLLGATQARRQPVELLTLSACQTALGDERAALGLAGVSVKAGARSALATLWEISDEAAAALLPEFYRQLGNPEVSTKAAALRNAQLKLLRDGPFGHPGYWSPFLLIGNWL